jgi:hypothetical protein
MEGLPDLSGDPRVRTRTLEKILDTNDWLDELGQSVGVPEDELERMREQGARTYRTVNTMFNLKQAAWN